MIRRFEVPIVFAAISLAMFSFDSCTSDADSRKPAVTINDLRLSSQDLSRELQATGGARRHGSPAVGLQEPEWLTRIIERELIVQEAQRMGLDRNPEFMQSIERFWKEALLKQALQRKAVEVASSIRVYEPEIEARYRRMLDAKQISPSQSMDKLKNEITQAIREEKQAEAMEHWVAELRAKARIQIDQQAVGQLP